MAVFLCHSFCISLYFFYHTGQSGEGIGTQRTPQYRQDSVVATGKLCAAAFPVLRYFTEKAFDEKGAAAFEGAGTAGKTGEMVYLSAILFVLLF